MKIIQYNDVGVPSIKPLVYPTSDEAKRLSAELSVLSTRQYESLQKAPYLLIARAEREVYDRRRARIEELRELLSKLGFDKR
jgi:hypothetical protein